MSSRNETSDWQKSTSENVREMAGKIRRMAITLTTRAFWQVAGYILDDGSKETRDVETFTGIGFYARPNSKNRAEAIVAFIGGARNPVIIATRDEDSRRAIAADLAEDETQISNTIALLRCKADGTIEARTAAGVALPLATKADLAAVVTAFNAHVHSGGTIAGFTGTPGAPAPAPTGTTVLKGQ